MEEIEATISGRVQLVMFRDFVSRKANRLGLLGFVRNNPNGTVTVIAQGQRGELQTFISHIKKGPMLSYVQSVSLEWRKPTTSYKNFSIAY